ncbi:hypothetical protein T4B_7490 [Trichinella pseudospiralis]|uniref:Uncharacterized protein n=1 Tax=Trichinella pseudospiralis TaxID=6337 RepID=A0A0V1GNC7_TRIPS|nr:hypothetical protein T4B_7490 [Trichinella pseudospiralis]
MHAKQNSSIIAQKTAKNHRGLKGLEQEIYKNLVQLDRKNGTSARNVVAGGENAGGENAGGAITALQSYPLLKTLR